MQSEEVNTFKIGATGKMAADFPFSPGRKTTKTQPLYQ